MKRGLNGRKSNVENFCLEYNAGDFSIVSQQFFFAHSWRCYRCRLTITALARGSETSNWPWILAISSIWTGSQEPASETVAPPRVVPDLLSMVGPKRRIADPARNEEDKSRSSASVTSEERSLLIPVSRT